MLIRLVRMRFRPDQVEAFLALYRHAQPQILQQPGCFSVQLVREIDDPAAFATWSVWADAGALDSYRTSAFFRDFWPDVKALFRERAEPVSFDLVEPGSLSEALNRDRLIAR